VRVRFDDGENLKRRLFSQKISKKLSRMYEKSNRQNDILSTVILTLSFWQQTILHTGILPADNITYRHFASRQYYIQVFCQQTISPTGILPADNITYRHFASRQYHLQAFCQ
jgi:hypothetical protein